MKLRIASLTLLCLALAVIPASAQVLYSNGSVNGTTDAWTINFGYTVSDTFTANGTMTGFDFYTWLFPGDSVLTVDWQVTSAEFGGTTYGSGTSNVTNSFISTNQYGYDINKETVSGLNLALNGSYWLNLNNATSAQGNPVYWDENSGKSQASESALGTIPSEAFDINGGTTTTSSSTTSTGTVPEPSSIMLFGSGILGLAGVLRRKLF